MAAASNLYSTASHLLADEATNLRIFVNHSNTNTSISSHLHHLPENTEPAPP